ncbi:MAG TPA: hypothetical protein VK574_13155 [Terracidiphilus sp.]|jgi:hypothetical protein|nr:hypothetical protein [Terracidiphilus sp.]
MKTTIRTIALATLVAIASLSQTVIAQTGRPSTKVAVPFAFDYGTQHFAAGVYTVSMRDKNILTLNSGNHSAWAMIQAGYDPTQNKAGYVVFRKYGDRYFLTEYAPASGSLHASVSESAAERRAARDFAANHLAPSRVQLALMSNSNGAAQSK